MHETTFSLEYSSEEIATIVERSLQQEAGAIDGDRTQARLSRHGAEVAITIEAEDLIALRAGQNTWLGLVSVAERSRDIAATEN